MGGGFTIWKRALKRKEMAMPEVSGGFKILEGNRQQRKQEGIPALSGGTRLRD